MTLNEEKLNELENALQAVLDAVDYSKKGCFGSLLCSEGDDYCVGCADLHPCKDAVAAAEVALIAEINEAAVEAEAEAVDQELKAEVLDPKPIEKPVAKAEADQPSEAPAQVGKMRERGAEVDGVSFKIKSKIKVDWNAVVGELMAKKPESYSAMAAVVRGFVAKEYTASAYNWTGKLIDGLCKQGVIAYNPKEKIVAWQV